MSRDFLFASGQSNTALTRLISTAATATGFMKGAPGDAPVGWHQLGRDNRDFYSGLHQRLAASYPGAGVPFYAVRLWTNLIWQPAYLGVIAVHLHGALPELGTIAQAPNGIYVSDYRLRPGPQYRDATEAMIGKAGQDLRRFAERVLAEINTFIPLKCRPALYLLAERMLSLMVRLRHFQPSLSLQEQLGFTTLWLEAMGLTGYGDLEVTRLPDGRDIAIVARKGCCLDYLITPDRLCASCPKQSKALRVMRQRDNAMAEMAVTDR